ncbi:carbohydrate ABC transporter permease [Clostridium perfringens]|uniref:carbohydrate ABC transporter permease n=1 Tax=Clostridium perfringens TaxID=1502 RepID=UPI003D2F97C9
MNVSKIKNKIASEYKINDGEKFNNKKILIHGVLILGSIAMIFPFLWMVLTSLKTFSEAIKIPVTFIPENFQWDNYVKAWNTLPFATLFYNTIIMMLFRILFAIIFSSMAGYAFAKLNFPGKKILFTLVVIQLMLPAQIFIIPQYSMVADLGWLNTIKALVFPGIVSAFGVFFLRQFYMSLPNELSEAAKIDGCNQWQIFSKIMLPLTKTPLMALSIFTAVFAWSDLMWPLIVNMSMNKMTLASGLASLSGQFSTDYPVMMAGAFIAMWPMIIIYLLFQKQFVEGIALTGGK